MLSIIFIKSKFKKMKNLKITLGLLVLLAVISSCTKNNIQEIIKTDEQINNTIVNSLLNGRINPDDYNFVISLDKNIGTVASSISYGFYANYSNVNVGDIFLSSAKLNFNPNTLRYSLINSTDSLLLKGNENQFFGIKNNVIANNKAHDFYIPQIITPIYANTNSSNNFSKSSGIIINWVSDAQNTIGKIAIAIEYNPNTWKNSFLFPRDTLWGKYYVVDDNLQTFTIPSADLASLPVGCMPNLHIGRGAMQTNDDDSTKYLVTIISHSLGKLLDN